MSAPDQDDHIADLRRECGRLAHEAFERWYAASLADAPEPTDWRALIAAALQEHGREGRWLTGEELAERLPRCELEWLLPRLEGEGFLRRRCWSPSRSMRQWRRWPGASEQSDARHLAAERRLDPVDAILAARKATPLGWVWELAER